MSRKTLLSFVLPLILAAVLSPSARAQFTQQGNKLVGTGVVGASTQGDSVALSTDGNTLAVGGSSDGNNQGAVWVYLRTNGVYTQQGKLVGTGAAGAPFQGISVALSADGNTLIEGGPADSNNVGAAWVFTRSNGSWIQQAKLVGTGNLGGANFGISVELSSDGNTAIIGGELDNNGQGAAWVFTRTNGAWNQQQKLIGSGNTGAANQGTSVSLSSDGSTALVGGNLDASGLGAAWVWTRSGTVWGQQGSKLVGTGAVQSPTGVFEGWSVALSGDGNTAILGGPGDNSNVGAAWIFTRTNGTWGQQGGKLVGSNSLGPATQGFAVSLSNDGNTAVIGGPGDNFILQADSTGAVWVFRRSSGSWNQLGSKLVGSGGIHGTIANQAYGPAEGRSVAISSDAGTIAAGGSGDASNVGAAWVFVQSATQVPHFTVLTPPSATSGTSFTFSIFALDANNVGITNYAGTVHFTSSDGSATLPSDSTLAAGAGTFSVTLRTAGNQTITATDTGNPAVNGTSPAIVVSGNSVTGGVFTQQGGKLTGSGAQGAAQQGSVALSSDGNTLAVGAFNDNNKTGAVWIYTRSNGTWSQQGTKLVGNGAVSAGQGFSVALSADGNTLIEGGPFDNSNVGSVWIFTRANGVWSQQGAKLVGSAITANATHGRSVSLSADGNTAVVGGSGDTSSVGAAWVYTRSGGAWSQQGNKLTGLGATGVAGQGNSVAVSGDGNTLIIGGNSDNNAIGASWIFTRSNGVWTQQGNKLVGNGNAGASAQGSSVALSSDGSTAIIGGAADSNGIGAAWIFTRSSATWTQQGAKLVGAGILNGRFGGANQGTSVGLSNDGNTAVVGAPGDNGSANGASIGAAWVFKRSGSTWTQAGKLVGSGSALGTDPTSSQPTGPGEGRSVAISGDGGTAAVGGAGDNGNQGAVWVFSLTQTRLSISAPSSANAGTAVNVTVTALDNNNATITSYSGRVHFTSTDIAAVLPADTTLTSGTGTFPVTLKTGGSQTVTATDLTDSGVAATSNTITVNGAPLLSQGYLQQGAKLLGSAAVGAAGQGAAVALSATGDTLAVGGPADNGGAGTVWIYTRSNGAWNQQGLKLSFTGATGAAAIGGHVALSADGNTLVVGGGNDNNGVGAAWVFTRSNGAWSQQGAKLVGSNAVVKSAQGAVAISSDGNTIASGGQGDNFNSGAVWIFTRTNGTWAQQGNKLTAQGNTSAAFLGTSVALSGNGKTIIAGGPGDNFNSGASWIYTRDNNGVWSQQGNKLVGTIAVGSAFQGISVAISSDGNTALVGGDTDNRNLGASWTFTRSNGVWTQQSELIGADLNSTCAGCNVFQGYSVALSGDGNTALVGAPLDSSTDLLTAPGAGVIFRRNGGAWNQPLPKLVGSGGVNAQAGISAALSADGSTAALGGSSDNGSTGAVFIFALPRFVISTPPGATGGTPINFTVSALDANNLLRADYFGTLHFSSSDPAATLPADSSLSSGLLNASATLRTGGNQTITAVDSSNAGETGTSATIAVTSTTIAPNPVSVTPNSGNSAGTTYTFVYNDSRGFADLNVINVLVNNFLDGRHGCYLAYVVPANTLYLVDDAGDAGGPFAGSVIKGSAAAISNSQCSVSIVSATGAGNTFTLVLNINWTASFAGDKIIHLAARDLVDNNSGWYPLGVWRIPGGAQTVTAVTGMNPTRGTGLAATTFTFSFSDTKGYQDLGVENVLVNNNLDGRHACYLAISRPGNVLFLENDNGDGLLGGQSLAASGSISNSQCTVSWGSSAPLNGSGNNLTLTLNIAFTAAFGGNRVIYVATRDINEQNSTDWHAMGTWTPQ